MATLLFLEGLQDLEQTSFRSIPLLMSPLASSLLFRSPEAVSECAEMPMLRWPSFCHRCLPATFMGRVGHLATVDHAYFNIPRMQLILLTGSTSSTLPNLLFLPAAFPMDADYVTISFFPLHEDPWHRYSMSSLTSLRPSGAAFLMERPQQPEWGAEVVSEIVVIWGLYVEY